MVGIASPSTASSARPALEAEVRELRLIAEHKPRYNRRSRFPEKVTLHQAHPRALAPAVAGAAGARRRRRLPRPVLVEEDRREVPRRAARHVPGPAVLRPARRRPPAAAPCVLAEMGRCLSPATAASTRRRTPPSCASCATRCCAAPTRWSTRSTPGWPCWPTTSGSRRPAPTATGWPRSCAPPPAPSGSPR